MKKIELNEFNLVKVDPNNEEHIKFLKTLFENDQDQGIQYLGNLSNFTDSNAFLIQNLHDQKIGYFSMSNPIVNHLGLTTTSLYYIISPKLRSKGYGTAFLTEISNYLFQHLDMLVLTIDKTNIASRTIAEKVNFKIEYENEEEEEIIYTKYAATRKKEK